VRPPPQSRLLLLPAPLLLLLVLLPLLLEPELLQLVLAPLPEVLQRCRCLPKPPLEPPPLGRRATGLDPSPSPHH